MIENGADVNFRSDKGILPIHWAALLGNAGLNAWFSLDLVYAFMFSLIIHSKKGRTNIVKLLIDHNADINAKKGDDGFTPLHLAAANGL